MRELPSRHTTKMDPSTLKMGKSKKKKLKKDETTSNPMIPNYYASLDKISDDSESTATVQESDRNPQHEQSTDALPSPPRVSNYTKLFDEALTQNDEDDVFYNSSSDHEIRPKHYMEVDRQIASEFGPSQCRARLSMISGATRRVAGKKNAPVSASRSSSTSEDTPRELQEKPTKVSTKKPWLSPEGSPQAALGKNTRDSTTQFSTPTDNDAISAYSAF